MDEQMKKNIIFADFGNTNAKFLPRDGNFVRIPYDTPQFQSILNNYNSTGSTLVFASVNDKSVAILHKFDNIKLINIHKLQDISDFIDYGDIEGIGADRLLGLVGALSIAAPPLITIDCGTALTINALDKNKKMLGGLILPGPQLQEFALRSRTDGLTNIEITPPDELLGKNTQGAMSSGIINGIALGIISIVKQIKKEKFNNNNCNIFLTGGASVLILPYLQKSLNIIYDELLVIKGIKHIYELWSTGKN